MYCSWRYSCESRYFSKYLDKVFAFLYILAYLTGYWLYLISSVTNFNLLVISSIERMLLLSSFDFMILF